MKKKLTIFGLSLALVLSMILISVGQQPMILPGFNLTDLVDVNATTPSDGYVITWDSATAKWIPAASGGGAGDVTGPGSSTDNAIATFHLATGKIIQQNHSVLIDDSSNISGVNQITVPTIYGSVASGGDLTLYSTSHATLGQIKLESDLETDRWLDQASNTFIGVDVVGAGNLAHVAGDTGYFNSALGASALYSNTTGYLNSAFGHYALYSNTIGHWNSALGKSALRCNTEGHSNLASGMNALYSNTTGDNNSALGYSAGRYQNDGTSALQTPENSVYLGALAKSGSDPAGGEDAITNEIVIGYDATGAGANTVTLGNTSIVSTILRGQVDVNSAGATGEIGIDFNSISSTYSRIAQSDAEGIASSSDTRLGLDPTLRTFNLLDRGDIASDLDNAAASHPTMRIWTADASDSLFMLHDGADAYFKTDDGLFIFQTDEGTNASTNIYVKPKGSSSDASLQLYDTDSMELKLAAHSSWADITSGATHSLYIQYTNPADVIFFSGISSGNPSLIINGWNTAGSDLESTEFTMDDTNDEFLIQAANSANHEGITISLPEANQAFRIRDASAETFSVVNDGYIKGGTSSASLADNATHATTIPDSWTGIVIVQNVTDTTSGVYHLDGTAIAAINQNAAFTVTQGTDNKTNVYVAGNVLTVENTHAGAKTVKVMFIGT